MAFRPLGLVREMLQDMGLKPTYAYEDLVFVEHNAFLLQFEDASETVGLHVNTECPAGEVDALIGRVSAAGAAAGLTVVMRGRYEVQAGESDGSLSLHFLES